MVAALLAQRECQDAIVAHHRHCKAALGAAQRGDPSAHAVLPPDGSMMAVLMLIRSPRRLISAPPELPGLIEASVWMKSS